MKPRRQGELLPLAEADLHATGPGGAELRLEPGHQLGDHIVRSRTLDGCHHRGLVVEAGNITNADGMSTPGTRIGRNLDHSGRQGANVGENGRSPSKKAQTIPGCSHQETEEPVFRGRPGSGSLRSQCLLNQKEGLVEATRQGELF